VLAEHKKNGHAIHMMINEEGEISSGNEIVGSSGSGRVADDETFLIKQVRRNEIDWADRKSRMISYDPEASGEGKG